MSYASSLKRVYTLCKPQGTQPVPLFFDSPHSGTHFPDDFAFACEKKQLQKMADLYVDELYKDVCSEGAYFLKAEFSRSYIDVNRHEDDIDMQLIDGLWPKSVYQKGRASAGYGIVYRLAKGDPIYTQRLPQCVVLQRIEGYYRPYHRIMNIILSELHETYGQIYHVNCHSMPSMHKFLQLPDIVLSDRNGTSCSPSFLNYMKDLFSSKDYSVGINHPYKGGEILRKYGKPLQNKHSLQIEINRSLYMNEQTLEKHEGFNRLQKDIKDIMGELADNLQSSSDTLLAAD